jgi:lectin, mannose-binding 2
MAMYGDGQTSYDKANDGKNNEYGGCSARGIRGANVPTKAKIKYFQDKSLKLELQYRAEDRWELCFEKDNPPPIPSVAYLGFSAETGELSDNHDIISVQTKNLYKPGQQGNTGSTKSREKGKSQDLNKDTGGSWAWFFIRTVIFILVVVGAYVGYTAWRNSKKTHRF